MDRAVSPSPFCCLGCPLVGKTKEEQSPQSWPGSVPAQGCRQESCRGHVEERGNRWLRVKSEGELSGVDEQSSPRICPEANFDVLRNMIGKKKIVLS